MENLVLLGIKLASNPKEKKVLSSSNRVLSKISRKRRKKVHIERWKKTMVTAVDYKGGSWRRKSRQSLEVGVTLKGYL